MGKFKIFVTVGSQKFQFNRLLKKIDELIEYKIIDDEVFAQIGKSDYVPRNYRYSDYIDRNEFEKYLDDSDLVITHGGTGIIVTSVKKQKKVIAIPRLSVYNEHVDDHQIQVIKEFEKKNILLGCSDMSCLADTIKKCKQRKFAEYKSNTNAIIESIEEFLSE